MLKNREEIEQDMRKAKAIIAAGLTAAMLFGCGSAGDESVSGLSVEKLEDVTKPEEAVAEATVEETSQTSGLMKQLTIQDLSLLCTLSTRRLSHSTDLAM